jgi:MoxR-like ATPase
MARPALVGQDQEVQALAALIEAGAAAGRAAVVVADPGIGKSALLDAAGQAARARGFRVLTASGVEPELQLPFAGLHQLQHRPPGKTVLVVR